MEGFDVQSLLLLLCRYSCSQANWNRLRPHGVGFSREVARPDLASCTPQFPKGSCCHLVFHTEAQRGAVGFLSSHRGRGAGGALARAPRSGQHHRSMAAPTCVAEGSRHGGRLMGPTRVLPMGRPQGPLRTCKGSPAGVQAGHPAPPGVRGSGGQA